MELAAEKEEAEERRGAEYKRKGKLVGAEAGDEHMEKEVNNLLGESGSEVANDGVKEERSERLGRDEAEDSGGSL